MNYKLSELRAGQKGIIVNFSKSELLLKLLEMGCIPGEVITIEQVAPLSGPISISVSGYLLSLRKTEAEQIYVEIVDNHSVK
ncbi:MAG: ferrous iron transport protein A [Chitinophagaceae bacterium]|nr:ferrous iron transport protein A [Chitinophagaceae bacterium]